MYFYTLLFLFKAKGCLSGLCWYEGQSQVSLSEEKDCRCLFPGEILHLWVFWGSFSLGLLSRSAPRCKSPGLQLFLSLGREAAAEGGQELQRFLTLTQRHGGETWRRAPAPLCAQHNLCWAAFTVTWAADGKAQHWALPSAPLLWVLLATECFRTQFPNLQNIHSARSFRNFWWKLTFLLLSKPLGDLYS